MEKPTRSKARLILSFLPRAATSIFPNQPFSPGRDRSKPFSGPIVSIFPAEAGRKTRNGSFDAQEPTSPKVSCIGQIKHSKKKKVCKAKREKRDKKDEKLTKPSDIAAKIFGKSSPDDAGKGLGIPAAAAPPSLGQLRKFSSGREALASFDWKAGGPNRIRGYYSDEERGEDDDDSDDDVAVPHSAPLGPTVGTRKEVNLWKGRTLGPPKPLEFSKNKNNKYI